jgi:exopolyphosphatase/guanosine-5'-triphosphate,3'-diphosphate pyrophosphatase
MGSNSFRLEIGQLSKGRYKRIEYLKDRHGVRLGGGPRQPRHADRRGHPTRPGLPGALPRQRLTGFEPSQVRAVATQTLREARNRDAFLATRAGRLRLPIEVISGREEARLIYAGVSRLQPSSCKRLVIDIGGRSTEMILGRGRTPTRAESFQRGQRQPVDAATSRRAATPPRPSARHRSPQAPSSKKPSPCSNAARWHEALGSSGTVGAVSQMLAANGITDGRITPDGLRWLHGALHRRRLDRVARPAGPEARTQAVLGGGLASSIPWPRTSDIAEPCCRPRVPCAKA